MGVFSFFRNLTFLFAFLMQASAFANTPLTFTYQGKLWDATGTTPMTGSFDVTFTILSSDGNCILYEEQFLTLDLTASSGTFAEQIGTGAPTANNPGPMNTLLEVFTNYTTTPIPAFTDATCPSGDWLPLAGSTRLLRITVFDGAVSTVLTPDQVITSVPTAMIAEQLSDIPTQSIRNLFNKAVNDTFVRYDDGNDGSPIATQVIGVGGLNSRGTLEIHNALSPETPRLVVGTYDGGAPAGVDLYIQKNSPSLRLASKTNGGANSARIEFSGNASGAEAVRAAIEAPDDTNELRFSTGGTNALILDENQDATFYGDITMQASTSLGLGTWIDDTHTAGWDATQLGYIWYNTGDHEIKFWDGDSVEVISSNGVAGSTADADNDTKIQVEETADEDKIRFDTAGTERMIIDETGKVGIGTTSPAYSLEVNSVGTGIYGIRLDGEHGISIGATDGNAVFAQTASNFGDTTYALFGQATNNATAVRAIANTGTAGHFSSTSGYGLLVTSGNVGIGSTAPLEKLVVQGDAGYAASIRAEAGSSAGFQAGSAGDPDAYFSILAGGGTNQFNTTNRNFRLYSTAAPNAMTMLAASGYLGLGTTTPSTPLHIYNTANTNGLRVETNNVANNISPTFEVIANTMTPGAVITKTDGSGLINANIQGLLVNHTAGALGNVGANDYRYAGGEFNMTHTGSPTTAKDVFGVRSIAVANDNDFTVYGGYFSGASTNGTAYGVYSAAGQNYFNGNVGIGTTAPSERISIGSATDDEDNRDSWLSLDENTANAARGCFRYNGTALQFTNDCDSGTPTWSTFGAGGGDNLGNHTATSQVLLTGGTAAAPAISFSGDTDTGMYRMGADFLGFSTGGVARMYIANGGQVGINDYNGFSALAVGQGTNTVGLWLSDYGAADEPNISLFKARGTSAAPTSVLADDNLGALTFNGQSSGSFMVQGAVIRAAASENWVTNTETGTRLEFWTTANDSSTASRKMVVDGSGNVGVGTASPTAALHLKAGTATAGTAPLKLTAGVNLTAPEPGAIEYDGTNLFYTDGTNARRTLAISSGQPDVDFSVIGEDDYLSKYDFATNSLVPASVTDNGTTEVRTLLPLYLDSPQLYLKLAGSDQLFLHSSGADSNVFLGKSSGNLTQTGTNNSSIGTNSMVANTTGSRNIAVGGATLYQNLTGNDNVAIGYYAVATATNRTGLVGIGTNAQLNTTGAANTAIGYGSQQGTAGQSSGGSNTSVGYASLNQVTTGFQNVAIGESALFASTIGASNVAIGKSALAGNSTGSSNVAVGEYAGLANTTGSGNVFLGNSAGSLAAGSNKLFIANSNDSTPLIYGDFSTNSLDVNGTLRVCAADGTACTAVAGGAADNLGDHTAKQALDMDGNHIFTNSGVIYGGALAFDSLTIESTSNGLKGEIALNPNGGNVGIGIGGATELLHVEQGGIRLGTTSDANNVLDTAAAAGAPSGNLYWGDRQIVDSSNIASFGVSELEGTANQISASASIGSITLSIPSDFRAPGSVNAVTGVYTGAGAGTLRLSSAGALSNITTIGASGAVTLTNLTASRLVATTAGQVLTSSMASSVVSGSVTDETGSGVLVFGTSPNITTSLTTGSASFDLINANATTVNFAGASTALTIGATTGTATMRNALVDFTGSVKIRGGTPGAGKVLTSDADGDATWETPGAVTCPAGFTQISSNGLTLGCMQTNYYVTSTLTYDAANEYCFDTHGGRLPSVREYAIALNNYALTNENTFIWVGDPISSTEALGANGVGSYTNQTFGTGFTYARCFIPNP